MTIQPRIGILKRILKWLEMQFLNPKAIRTERGVDDMHLDVGVVSDERLLREDSRRSASAAKASSFENALNRVQCDDIHREAQDIFEVSQDPTVEDDKGHNTPEMHYVLLDSITSGHSRLVEFPPLPKEYAEDLLDGCNRADAYDVAEDSPGGVKSVRGHNTDRPPQYDDIERPPLYQDNEMLSLRESLHIMHDHNADMPPPYQYDNMFALKGVSLKGKPFAAELTKLEI